MLSKMSGYVKYFVGATYMSFVTKNEELLETYNNNKIWGRVINSMKKDLIVYSVWSTDQCIMKNI